MSATLSQKEYIKRYLSKSDDKKKKRRKKHDGTSQTKLRIVDDDIDVSNMRPIGDDELELYNLDEDAPQIAGVIDERPEELRVLEEFRASKRWKVVSDDTSDIKVTEFGASTINKTSESDVNTEKHSIHGRGSDPSPKSDESSSHHPIRDVKRCREDSDTSPPRKSRVKNVCESSSQRAPELHIKSEKISDCDSDISVSRKSKDSSERKALKKLEAEHKSSHRQKTNHHSKKDSGITRNNARGIDASEQKQNNRFEKLSERNHNELHNLESNSDLSPPRLSNSRDTKKHRLKELRIKDEKKESCEENDSYLSPPRPLATNGREKHNRLEGVKRRHRRKGSMDESDSDLSLRHTSKSKHREKHKKNEVKKREKNKESSNESDSDLSPPRLSKRKDTEKNMPKEVKRRHRTKVSNEDSDSDLSPPRPSKNEDRGKIKTLEGAKRRHGKKGSSDESDSDLSVPRPSKSEHKKRHRRQDEVKKRQKGKGLTEESDLDLSPPRPTKSKYEEKNKKSKEFEKKDRKKKLSDDSDVSPTRHKHKRPEKVRRHREKGSSDEYDSDLSPSRPSKSKDADKLKGQVDVKRRDRRKGLSGEDTDSSLSQPSSKDRKRYKWPDKAETRHVKRASSVESDSDSSPPQPSKKKDKEKHKRHKGKRRHRRKGSDGESDSDLSSQERQGGEKKRHSKKWSSEESDAGSSQHPSRSTDSTKHRSARERDDLHHRITSDMHQSRPKKVESGYSKTKRRDSESPGQHTSERNRKNNPSPVRGSRLDSRLRSPEDRSVRKHWNHNDTSAQGQARHRRPEVLDHKSNKNNSHRDGRSPEAGSKKLEKTLDGKSAGLQDARQLKEEIKSFAERENDLFTKMSDAVSGRVAEAVQRDRKTGKKRDLEEEARKQREKEEKEQKVKEKYSRWGKGLKQVEEQKQNLEEAMKLMEKPLARYADDEDLDKHLRDQEREGDPMLEYIRSKKPSGDSKTSARPKYQGSYPTNRFGIPPGHRWDGVDRSSGYEKQWFEQRNAQKAREEEAYKWSTADM